MVVGDPGHVPCTAPTTGTQPLFTLKTPHGTGTRRKATPRIMDSQADDISSNWSALRSFQSQSTSTQSTAETLIQRYRQCIWPISSIASVLSARCLLIERSFHYPVHLYISQIVVTGAFSLFLHASRRHFVVPNKKTRWSRQATQLMAATYCLVAMAMFCALQAILHFTNLPILIMLTVRTRRSQSLHPSD